MIGTFDPGQVLFNRGNGNKPYFGSNLSNQHTPVQTLPGAANNGTGLINRPLPTGDVGSGNTPGNIFNGSGNPLQMPDPSQSTTVPNPPGQNNTLAPEAVRATSTSLFDPNYLQNLATFAGGQFMRPGGSMNFDPTSSNLFGNPTGGGSAPVPGMPDSLLAMALGGTPFSFTPPQGTTTPTPDTSWMGGGDWQDWMKPFRQMISLY